jgi:membrane protein implicated in regulation of membrane protease activity
MPGWVVWAIVAVLLAVGEIATPGMFFLGPIALAAVIAAGVSLAGGGLAIELVAFILAALASLAVLRPLARRHLQMPAATRTGTAALTGASALVVDRVDSHGGRVKIGGEVWSARSYVDGQVLEPGMRVEVAKIEGATALVYE